MSDSADLPTSFGPKAISERAAWWLVKRHASSDWVAEDQVAFEFWMDKSPAHMMAYWRLEAVWDRGDRLSALRKTFSEAKQLGKARRIGSSIAFGTVGLSLLGVLIAGGLSYIRPQTVGPYETAIGGHKILTLGDGSKIELNTNTKNSHCDQRYAEKSLARPWRGVFPDQTRCGPPLYRGGGQQAGDRCGNGVFYTPRSRPLTGDAHRRASSTRTNRRWPGCQIHRSDTWRCPRCDARAGYACN